METQKKVTCQHPLLLSLLLYLTCLAMSSKKNSSTRPVARLQSKRKVVESDESKVEIVEPSSPTKKKRVKIIEPSSPTKKKCVDIVQPDGTAKSRHRASLTPPPGSQAYQQLPGVSVSNMVLAAMQSVTASSSLPIFGLQGPACPGSAVTAVKDLTVDTSGGKQLASHPECIKIKTEKAMYMESIKPDTAGQASPLTKPKSKLVKAVVPVPEPLSVRAVTSNNIEDEENDLKSPFSATKELQPEDDAFSDLGAAIAIDDQIVQDTLVLDNLSEAGDPVTGIEAGDCESDTFESGSGYIIRY
ncbi:hypothetical protein L208DRAFT_1557815 [Tricholoma matsutake]|nr:hypothetical protein L208DRAFT_1557815 [Tricholoma matsutake 945]